MSKNNPSNEWPKIFLDQQKIQALSDDELLAQRDLFKIKMENLNSQRKAWEDGQMPESYDEDWAARLRGAIYHTREALQNLKSEARNRGISGNGNMPSNPESSTSYKRRLLALIKAVHEMLPPEDAAAVFALAANLRKSEDRDE